MIKKFVESVKWRTYDLVCKKFFIFWEKLGFHITRNHFYEPVPDIGYLKNRINFVWGKYSELVGINLNEQKQIELLDKFRKNFKDEYDEIPLNKDSFFPYKYYINNSYFGSVDGEVLYCMIRYFKPKKSLEIGGGYSTYLAVEAILKNFEENSNYNCELTTIEPYPKESLIKFFKVYNYKLIKKPVQEIPFLELEKLSYGDILFIDSSHVLKIGSDVQYLYLEILPRLKKGVIVHIHDIFLPSEYPKNVILKDYNFFNEQYILQAFLTFNDSFEVLFANSYLHLFHSAKLKECFNSYNKKTRWSASFWIRRIKE